MQDRRLRRLDLGDAAAWKSPRGATRGRSTPGSVFVALRGATPTARRSRDAVIATARSRSSPKRARPPDIAVPWLRSPTRGGALAALAAAFERPSERRAHARRHHRHQRQDDDLVPAGVHLRSRRRALRPHRHGRSTASATARSRRAANDARGAGAPADAAGDGDRRMRRLRDGGVVARAGAAPRRRAALRRRASSPI